MFDLSELSPRERRLLRSANNTANNGKFPAAEQQYRDFLEEFPESVPALVGLARVVNSADEREKYLHEALALDPENEIAAAALQGESLEELLDPQPEEDEDEEPIAAAIVEEIAPPAPPTIARTDDTARDEHAYDAAEGGLRCNKCGKPIDQHNSKYTAVGYRCNDCIREIEDAMFSAGLSTYAIAFLIGLVFSTIVATMIGMFVGGLGFFGYIIVFFISSGLGTTIGSAAFRAGGRNRGRYLPLILSVSIWLGAALALGILRFVLTGTAPLILLAIFAFSAASTAFLRVR